MGKNLKKSPKCKNIILILLIAGLLTSGICYKMKKEYEKNDKKIIEEGIVLSKKNKDVRFKLEKETYLTTSINIYVDLDNNMEYDASKDILIVNSINNEMQNLFLSDEILNINEGDNIIIERNPEDKIIDQHSIKAINNKQINDCHNKKNVEKLKELLEKSR